MVLALQRSLLRATRSSRSMSLLQHQQKASKHTHTLVLIRHGESEWNKQNRFTGWYDVQLSDKGNKEARACSTRRATRSMWRTRRT